MRLTLRSLLTLLFLCGAWITRAQVTTAGLHGFIKDSENKGLPGATIKAVHTPSGTTYGTMTQTDGNFVIQGMRPGGPYTVEITYIGMTPQKVEGIELSLGESYTLNRSLKETEGEEIKEVQIVGNKSAILNSDRTGAATNINSRSISRLPNVNRSLTDLTRLTPQSSGNISPASSSGGFAGRDGRYNNIQIDGANFNNGFGLSSDPLPGGGNQPISLDAIDEVQVNVAPYDVRQSGFTGAGINAVTRSGTNELSGSAYGFLRPKSFTGLNVGNQKLKEDARISNKIIGARLGGPIIKDKLFFFANFEYENRQASGNTWLATRPGLPQGGNVTRVSAADLDAVSSYLKSNYGYDPGAYEGYANNYTNKNTKALLRLDWNINDKHKLSIRYNQMNGTNDQGTNNNSGPNPRSSANRISSESISFENANYSFKNTVYSVAAELNSTFGSRISNQFLATYSRIQDTRETPGSIFPFVDIWQEGRNYISFGTELFSYNNDVINHNFNFTDNITYITGRHTFTAGASFQTMSYANSYLREGTSYYRYDSLSQFLSGGRPSSYAVTYPFAGSDGYAKVKFGLAGAYIQDKIAANERLNITLGVRADLPIYLDKPPANPVVDTLSLLNKDGQPTHYTTASWPKSKPLFSPRVGVNFDVLGDKTLQLRGGTGIFTGNIPFVWLTNMPTNAGVLQNTFEPVDNTTLSQITHLEKDPRYWVDHLPERFPKSPGAKAPGSVALIDPDFKMPQIWRSNIGADYKLPGLPLVATLDVIYSKDINAVYQFNANRKDAPQQLDYSGDHRDYWGGSRNATYNPATGTVIPVLSNTGKGYSFTSSIGVTLNPFHGFAGSLFYTYTNAKDISGNPGSAAGSAWSNNYAVNDPNELLMGWSQYAVPHRIVGTLSYRIEYLNHLATTFSLFYQGSNQGRFAYTYNGDINADGVSLDLLYIPSNAADLNFVPIKDKNGNTTFSAEQQRQAYEQFVASSKALSNSKGGYVERNNGLMPWINRFDFRLLQDVFVSTGKNNRRHTLQVSLDMINVGNLLNKKWGLYKQLSGGSDYNFPLLNVVDANGRPTSDKDYTPSSKPSFQMITVKDEAGKTILPSDPFRNLFSTGSTWGMQLGLRYTF
ncbi:TonB-dependent receptor [Taibaiella helva]|uniref:TonB-dependent receptor n=1 Tax=Taibaiella helva TaxID=2301235 RepID=UPI000E59852E|nr:carboxypeptidase regulatory-like domain-containing protein [Taibaiella helva]